MAKTHSFAVTGPRKARVIWAGVGPAGDAERPEARA